MANYKLLLLLFLPLSIVVPGQVAEVPEVVIRLNSGEEWNGEILSVRDSSIVFSHRHGAAEDILRSSASMIKVMALNLVKEVSLPASSHTVHGMGIGMFAGCLAGCLIGGSQEASHQNAVDEAFRWMAWGEKNSNAGSGALIGGLAGTAVGAGVGAATSGHDTTLFGDPTSVTLRL